MRFQPKVVGEIGEAGRHLQRRVTGRRRREILENNRRQRGIGVPRAGHVETNHMRQHERIRQSVGHMEMAAKRIGQRVHRRHRGVGERHAGQHRAHQHVAAGLAIAAVAASHPVVAPEKAERFDRQTIGDRIFLDLGGVGLNRVDHRVDAGGGRDLGRQTER